MGKKSSKPPNVIGAAQAQGQASSETARAVTYADRPDQINPLGALTWQTERVKDPATGEWTTKWTQRQQLANPLQNVMDAELNALQQTGLLRNQALDRSQIEMGGAPDWQQFGDVIGMEGTPDELRQRAEDAAYQRETMRLDPQFQQRAEQLEVKLRNQGLRPGDQAYDAQMSSFGQERADAYERARLGSVDLGRQEASQMFGQQLQSTELANALRKQQIEEYVGKRGYGMKEAQALRETQGLSDLTDIVGS